MTGDTNLLKALHSLQEADAALVTQEPRVSEAVGQLRVARRALMAELGLLDPVPNLPKNTMLVPHEIASKIALHAKKSDEFFLGDREAL